MITHYVGNDSVGKAFQRVFMRTGIPMLPRGTQFGWVYDEQCTANEPVKATSVLTHEEVMMITAVCDQERHNPHLWFVLTKFIRSFPNQPRFYKATYLQPIVIAFAFANLTMKKVSNN